MKLQVTEGCTAFSYEVDDKEWVDLTHEECKETLLKLIESCDDCRNLKHVFIDLMQDLGEFKDLGTCDQCGDYVTRYTLEI